MRIQAGDRQVWVMADNVARGFASQVRRGDDAFGRDQLNGPAQ